ncbi:hypothetical protein BDP27DRAFT_1429409 [Rhodocollybia butyracea]|uniref:Uncharacterized protein n=1 Tax=Rhodocollybia butyracea TaxID=206335 RepID=A0A9P5PBV1_9AGAR|nr:hypothetical protein BDP27DRAFT_1429409 [Rhodocollybia butyracea]
MPELLDTTIWTSNAVCCQYFSLTLICTRATLVGTVNGNGNLRRPSSLFHHGELSSASSPTSPLQSPKRASSLGHAATFSISAQSSTGSSNFSFEAVSSFNAATLSASSVVAVASSSKTPVATTVATPEATGTPVLVPSRAQVRDDPVTRASSTAQFQTSEDSCLVAEYNAGDFHNSLIPITTQRAAMDLFGCLNFDPRHTAGN